MTHARTESASRYLQQEVDESIEFSLDYPGYANDPRFHGNDGPIRPKPTIAAGLFHLVSVTTIRIEIRFKDGTLECGDDFFASLKSFFLPFDRFLNETFFNPTLRLGDDFSTPRIIWDPFGQRFIVVAVNDVSLGELGDQKGYLVYGAVSRDARPQFLNSTTWKYFVMDVTDGGLLELLPGRETSVSGPRHGPRKSIRDLFHERPSLRIVYGIQALGAEQGSSLPGRGISPIRAGGHGH